jgi:hypothetical protein
MTEDNIQSLRCVMDVSKRLSSDDSSVDKAVPLDADVSTVYGTVVVFLFSRRSLIFMTISAYRRSNQ